MLSIPSGTQRYYHEIMMFSSSLIGQKQVSGYVREWNA